MKHCLTKAASMRNCITHSSNQQIRLAHEIRICRGDFDGVNHPETAGVFQDVFAEGGCVASVPDP